MIREAMSEIAAAASIILFLGTTLLWVRIIEILGH